MPINKLIIKWKKFYRQIFNPAENEIKFDTFTKFTLLSFRMILFDFQCLNENATLKMKVNHYGKKFFIASAIASVMVSAFQAIIFGIVNSENFDVVIRAISDASTFFFYALTVVILYLRMKSIRIILEELKILFESRSNEYGESEKKKRYLDGYNRVMKFFAGISVVCFVTSAAFWIPYLINGSVYYAVNFWFPFDEKSTANFPFIQLWTQWIIYLAVSFLLVPSSLLFVLVTIITMEFDSLKRCLRFSKLKTKDELAVKLAYFIDRHNKLLDVSDKLKEIFEPILFCNFFISSLILCIISFQLLTTASDPLTYMIDINYLATFAIQILLLCSYGQKLIDSSIAVADEIYNCDWTDLDNNEFKKQMIIIMIQAQRPVKLTAMGYADISLETFTAVKYFVVC